MTTPIGRLSHPSPNFGQRREGAVPRLIVLHFTAMKSAEAALDRLCDPAAEVSAHYLIDDDGTVYALVDEAMRAWHAGAGSWQGCHDVNSASIGIELDNDGSGPFADAQMAALEILLDGIMARWDIGPDGVIGHQDMAPGRKSDPGPFFPWRRLAAQGRAIWPDVCTPGDFQRDLQCFGYPDITDPEILLSAFRARFRPEASGPLSDEDRALAAGLAARFGVDRDVQEA
ncbi:MAG: N-acetylmuramoyl-L-alanine amidase [Pseudomonadota bacterium]